MRGLSNRGTKVARAELPQDRDSDIVAHVQAPGLPAAEHLQRPAPQLAALYLVGVGRQADAGCGGVELAAVDQHVEAGRGHAELLECVGAEQLGHGRRPVDVRSSSRRIS